MIWVDRALAATLQHPEVVCLTAKDRGKIAAGRFGSDRKDYLVSKTVNFHLGVPSMLWWHLRGATIQLTYATFWSTASRRRIFDALTSRMKDCSPN